MSEVKTGGDNQFEPLDFDAIWAEYYPRVKAVVQRKVLAIKQPVASASEVALSAFHDFVQGARKGQFPDLAEGDDTWKLLRTIAQRKVKDLRNRLYRKKRYPEGKAIIGEQVSPDSTAPPGIKDAPKYDSPTIDLEVADLLNDFLAKLTDERDRDVVLLKLQGASTATIAECLGMSLRGVQHKVKRIEENMKADLFNDHD